MNLKQKQLISTYFPEIAGAIQDNSNPAINALVIALIGKIESVKGEKGDKGDMPVKGKDYWTDAEINEVIKYVLKYATPVKGKDYVDGIDGKPGRDGKSIVGEKGDKGEKGDIGPAGKDAENIDLDEVITPLNKKIDNGMARIDGRIKLIDQRWHGGGITKVSTDTTLTGLGTPTSPLSVVGSGSVVAWKTPPESPDPNVGTSIFTVGTSAPTDVIADGTTLFEGFGYTYTSPIITLTNPCTQFLRYR